MKRRAAGPFLAVLLAAAPAGAARRAPAPRAEKDIKSEAAAIVDLFYGHDFDRAAAAAAALEAGHPGHPAGPLFEAVVEYQRWVARGARDDGSWNAIDRELARAGDEARALERSSPAESHYYLGAATGFRARGLAAQHHYLRAAAEAGSSLRQLKKALALDPTLTDAVLGLGMYHYFAARMPAAARPFARALTGERGDRDKGLAELWSVAESTGLARMEARAVLAMILSKNDEADWDGAEKLLAELMARYPRNPVYRLRRAYVAERRGDWARAEALADPDGAWLTALHPSLRENARVWALYRAGEARLLAGERADASKFFSPLDERRAPPELRGWIRLRRANVADADGRRGAALAAYEAVTDKSAGPVARRFRDAPFPGGPRDVAPYFAGY